MTSAEELLARRRRALLPTRIPAPPAVEGTVRIGLVDDHGAVAIAIRAALEQTRELRLVASATTVDDLLRGGRERLPFVILDLRLADGSSPANNVQRLRAAGSQVLAYTSGESRYLLRTVARSEVLGIVRKSEPLQVLTSALLRAAQGHPLIDPMWATSVSHDPRTADARLSRHEQHILSLFADGHTAQSVADESGIALSTVEDYIRRIRAKYTSAGRPAATKVDLYKRAIEDGFLPAPSHR